MEEQPSRGRGRPSRPALDRAQVLEVALAIADSDGLPAVTMRAVARRLSVSPMALYGHVGDKEALLHGLVERMLGELPHPVADATPVDQARDLLNALGGIALRHPTAFVLLLAGPTKGPAPTEIREHVYALLLATGVVPERIPRLERIITSLALGHAASRALGRFSGERWPLPAAESGSPALPAHTVLVDAIRADHVTDDELLEAVLCLVIANGGAGVTASSPDVRAVR